MEVEDTTKIKIFLWYLKKGVILTKDNLLKRKWKGSSSCCFCTKEESIQHLFFECHVAKTVWNAVFFAFGIKQPTNIANMLGSWLRGFSLNLRKHIFGRSNLRKHILVEATTMCWAIWKTRNDAALNRSFPNSYLQVIFRETY